MKSKLRPVLSETLKRETRALHAEVERAGIMPDLLRGKLDRRRYCALLRNLFEIYVALEAALARHAAHRCIAPIYFPELHRQTALADDLNVLHGDQWARELKVEPACTDYVRRLRAIEDTSPERLVAHAYVRYLGDLSGGQILRPIVAKALQLSAGRGTGFYEFPQPGVIALARRYRRGLDAIPIDGSSLDSIVAEAKLAFSLHARLFEALAMTRSLHDVP